jgi:hypothetical protein
MPTGDFTGKRLPVEEPPYLKVPDTNCWLLHTQEIEGTYAKRPDVLDWYRNALAAC